MTAKNKKFKEQFREVLGIVVINKEKLIKELENEKLYIEGYGYDTRGQGFNTGIDKAIEIIKSK